jgi:transcriptional regulator with XRE-family HTH domain
MASKYISLDGIAIAEHRAKLGWNQQDFANRSGVSLGLIKKLEPVRASLAYISTASKIAASFGMAYIAFVERFSSEAHPLHTPQQHQNGAEAALDEKPAESLIDRQAREESEAIASLDHLPTAADIRREFERAEREGRIFARSIYRGALRMAEGAPHRLRTAAKRRPKE